METNQEDTKNCGQEITKPLLRPGIFGVQRYNALEHFHQFKRDVEIYFKATDMYSKSNDIQVAELINLLGLEALQVVCVNSKLAYRSVDTILQRLEEHCASIKNVLTEHYTFFTRKQSEHELFNDYYEDLKKLIKNCSFNYNEDLLLRSQLVVGLYDKKLQERFLKEDLPLHNILYICRSNEWTKFVCDYNLKESLDFTLNGEPKIIKLENTSQEIEHIDIEPEVLINPMDINMEDIVKKICEIEKPDLEFEAENNKIQGNALGSTQESMPEISNSNITVLNNLENKKKIKRISKFAICRKRSRNLLRNYRKRILASLNLS